MFPGLVPLSRDLWPSEVNRIFPRRCQETWFGSRGFHLLLVHSSNTFLSSLISLINIPSKTTNTPQRPRPRIRPRQSGPFLSQVSALMSANENVEDQGGFMNIVNLFIPIRTSQSCSNPQPNMSSRTISTQTEETDPVISKGNSYSYMLVQELALNHPVRGKDKDEIYQTLFYYVCEIIEKHRVNFNGIVSRVDVTHYDVFASIANELFEANANEPGQLRITWGRILSLFAFAVRLAQEYQESPERVNYVTTYLDTYLSKHIIPFVRSSGGWSNLVQHFPPIGTGDGQLKRAILWSGLCVGLVATMYVSSLLR